jgi:hypothetical protein
MRGLLGTTSGDVRAVAANALVALMLTAIVYVAGGALPAAAALGLCVLAIMWWLGLIDWRLPIYGLLLYLPFSGIPILAAYGHRPVKIAALLAKDLLFVLPAYAGFLYAYRRTWRAWLPDRNLVRVILLLSLLVVVQALNPELPNRMTGLIGIKIWLFYIPLLVLGFHLVRTRAEAVRVLGLMCLVALVPAVVGLGEAALVYGGHAQTVYNAYGPAAASATQGFTQLDIQGGGALRRIPSTFSFVHQYYVFVSIMIALTYAWWRGFARARRARLFRAGVYVLMLAATFSSGQRGAFVFVPILVLLIAALEFETIGRAAVLRAAVPLVVLVAVIGAVGTSVGGLARHVTHLLHAEFGDLVIGGTRDAVHLTWLGLGSGIDSIGSRYAVGSSSQWTAVAGRWYESWYVKTWLELGVVGLVLVLVLWVMLLRRGLAIHRGLHDRGLKILAAVLVAILAWTMLYDVKAQYADLDPLNVYFWLLAGILLKLPALDVVRQTPLVIDEPVAAVVE